MNFLFPYLARWRTVNWTRYHQIFTRLANRGHDVYVLQPPASNMAETNFQEIQVEVPERLHLIEVPVNDVMWQARLPFNKLLKKGYYAVRCSSRIDALMKETRIDALMLYNIPQYHMMEYPCVTIFDYADDYLDMLRKELGPAANGPVMGLANRMLRKMIQRADLVLAVAHVLAQDIRRWNPVVEVLPNGASLDEFDSRSTPVPRIEALGQGPVIGFIGSFEYFVDFDLMLEVAQRLSRLTFLLVGGGRELEGVRQQVRDRGLTNVVLTGSVPHSEIAGHIAQMDVCLNIFKKMPVSHGACPLKLFEYLIMKKPVVTTRLREVEKIDKGFVFYGDTAAEVAQQIEFILENPAVGQAYALRGQETTLRDYDWNRIVDRLLDLVREAQVSRLQRSNRAV